MINEPSVDVMIRKLGTENEPISRYALCTIAAKRARQIIETERNAGVTDSMGKDKELLSACKDIAEGRVVIAKD
ncbi:MAG: DNA-directed RNA polymerase subunit omega [Clostridia bacterium]|nr:DNA-directed RNA polymerase subunit omega [Clostridia bacterium]